MQRLLTKILTTVVLIVILLLLIVFNITYFIGGPMVLNKVTDQDILENMKRKGSKADCSLVARFVDDDIYYVALCGDYYVFYNDDAELLAQRASSTLDVAKVRGMYETLYDLSDAEISLGYYQERPVYVISSDAFELLVGYDDYSLMRDYQKG